MKTLVKISLITLLFLTISCSKADDSASSLVPPNTLTFKGNPINFNALSIDDDAPNATTFYLITSLNNLNIQFYCKYLGSAIQPNTVGVVTYTADGVNFQPVSYYPNLVVRGYINDAGVLYNFISGEIKVKRNAAGQQSIEFVNLKLQAGAEVQTLSGTINLPKS